MTKFCILQFAREDQARIIGEDDELGLLAQLTENPTAPNNIPAKGGIIPCSRK